MRQKQHPTLLVINLIRYILIVNYSLLLFLIWNTVNFRSELEDFKQNLIGGYYSLYRTRSNDDHARHLHPKYDDYGSFGYWAKKLRSVALRELKETRSTITTKNAIKNFQHPYQYGRNHIQSLATGLHRIQTISTTLTDCQ